MILKSFIQNHIPTISNKTSGNMAILTMEEYKTSALIVLESRNLIGILSEKDILNMPELNKPIDLSLAKKNIYLNPYNHFCEAFKLIAETKVPLIPIIERNIYLGYISVKELVSGLGSIYNFTEIGVLKINTDLNNYSLSEISRIIELNNGLIISSFIENIDHKNNIKVHIVVNNINLTQIIKALNRHQWEAEEVYSIEKDQDDFNDRFDSFIRYLNT